MFEREEKKKKKLTMEKKSQKAQDICLGFCNILNIKKKTCFLFFKCMRRA